MQSSTIPAAYAVYEPLRAVEPPDSPLAGTLARSPDGRTVLLVDRAEIADWPGWGAASEPHLLSPEDIVRRADGHDVVVPALTERLEAFLIRRTDAGAPLSTGEAVTLAVSVLRGLIPSLARREDEIGEWWLADDGRPVLVEGVGDHSTRESSAAACRTVGEGMLRTRLGAALRELADELEEPAHLPGALDWEERLFACASPEPLTTEVLGPVRARTLAVESVSTSEQAPAPRSWWQRLAFHVDADLADAASDALTRVLRRIRRPSSSRKRPLLWAAGIAAVIVVGGLMWPSGEESDSTGDPDAAPAAAVETHVTPSPQPSGPAPAPEPASESESVDDTAADDPAAVTGHLLDARSECPDAECLARVLEDPARKLPGGVIDAPSENRSVTLLDDLGGLVVIRVDSRDGSMPMQLVTVVETEDGWRIRDVHDVSNAPS